MDGCIFCRIADHQAPARVLFEDDEVMAFHDVAPRAPTHVLVIPRRHIASLAAAGAGDGALLGRLLLAVAEAARRTGVADTGYRVVTNCGARAGQSVLHLHLHLLGGRVMAWPPG
jgi:histidine triad (HIT) family protein